MEQLFWFVIICFGMPFVINMWDEWRRKKDSGRKVWPPKTARPPE